MTERKIVFARKKIEESMKAGFQVETLLRSYHLNMDLMKYIMHLSSGRRKSEPVKLKSLVKEVIAESAVNPGVTAVITKRNLKSVRLWASKMDGFFKDLKKRPPRRVQPLVKESQEVFKILNISATKLFAAPDADDLRTANEN